MIYVYDATNKILPRDSSYIVDVVMWSKFGKSSISMKEVIIIVVFEECSWFKFNNLGQPLSMALKFYASVVNSHHQNFTTWLRLYRRCGYAIKVR